MKILIVGPSGTIGSFVARARRAPRDRRGRLQERRRAGRHQGLRLTSGVLSHDPIRLGAGASLANGALESSVRAAAIERPRGLRINAVSPGVLEESLPSYGPYFRGHDAVPGKRVANAYVKSVEGALTGQVFSVL